MFTISAATISHAAVGIGAVFLSYLYNRIKGSSSSSSDSSAPATTSTLASRILSGVEDEVVNLGSAAISNAIKNHAAASATPAAPATK